MTQTVVILGAGFAGLPLAHKLLKASNTTRSSSDNSDAYASSEAVKIVLVSPNSHFYWNVAAPRGIIPGEIAEDDIFLPIAPTFARYAADEFEFILGAATAVEPKLNVVRVRLSGSEGGESGGGRDVAVAYDQLVIATGSRLISGLPLKPVGTHETNLAQLRELQSQIERAGSIVIAGGGPTGVEVAGELAAKYGQTKTITLVENSDRVLYDAMPAVRAAAERDLLKLGVKFVYNNRATVSSDPLPPPQPGPDDETKKKQQQQQTEVHLSKGGTLMTDLFLPLYGVVVNTSFLPADFLDWEGNLKLQPDMRVLGTSNVWGLGDVGNLDPKQLAVLDAQILHLATALACILTSDSGAETETCAYRLGQKQVRFFSMGRRHATGSIGSWKVPGFVVALIKGRKLLVDYAPGYVSGQGMMGTGV